MLVLDGAGRLLMRDLLYSNAAPRELALRLRAGPDTNTISGAISIRTLRREPPPRAKRMLTKAEKASIAGRANKSERLMNKALSIHPDYLEARNNLGVLLFRTGRYRVALEQFERAPMLDPSSSRALANIALTYLCLNFLRDAESKARHALAQDPQ